MYSRCGTTWQHGDNARERRHTMPQTVTHCQRHSPNSFRQIKYTLMESVPTVLRSAEELNHSSGLTYWPSRPSASDIGLPRLYLLSSICFLSSANLTAYRTELDPNTPHVRKCVRVENNIPNLKYPSPKIATKKLLFSTFLYDFATNDKCDGEYLPSETS